MVRCKLKSILFCVATNFVFVTFADEMAVSSKSVNNSKKKSMVSVSSQLIDFKYDQKDLKDILNDFAQMRGINLIYPEADPITSTVTFDAGKKITMLEAWEFVVMILDQAGFTLVNRDAHTYYIVANKKASKEAIPLYINVNYNTLPDSHEKIRYMYYCNSIQLSTKQIGELTNILTNIFGGTQAEFAEKVYLDISFNAIIFTASAEMIKTAMHIVSVFDEVGVKEAVEIVRLTYAQASEVAQILTNMIGADPKKAGGYVSLMTGSSKARYFSEYANVLDLDPKQARKLNSLVVMGRNEDVANIIDFIKKYLDIPQQQGKSFFHVVELEWLQAATFSNILTSLVKGTGSSGQSTSSIASGLAFDPQIQIIAETVTQVQPATQPSTSYQTGGANSNASPVITPNVSSRGGNRIIIAASERDWYRIEALIKQVDVPRKQVIVEALVVDLDLEFVRRLATQIRTRGLTPSIFPKYMQAQAGLIVADIINSDSATPPNLSLTGDLSNILAGSTANGNPGPVGGFTTPGQSLSNNGQVPWNQNFSQSGEDVTSALTPSNPALNSSTIFTIGNGPQSNGVWAFFQLLSTHKSAKTLTRPVIIASNNQPASITSGQVKNLAGGVSSGNSPTVNYSYLPALISIGFTPIISHNDMVNLQININLTLWEDPFNETNGTQITRILTTNISSKSGDVIILGGLIKETVARSKRSIPLLDKVPIVSSFVANRYKNTTRDQLFILLRVTVVAPRTQGGMGNATKHAANYVIQQFEDYEDAFSCLKDPITRWFFNEDMDRGSEQVNDKLGDLTKTGKRPTMESEMMSQIEGFVKPKYESNPLGVSWLSDKAQGAKEQLEDKKVIELENKLKTIVSPFSTRTVL